MCWFKCPLVVYFFSHRVQWNRYRSFSVFSTVMSSSVFTTIWATCVRAQKIIMLISHFILKQESPPAWTLEAYQPRRIKYYSVGYPPARVPPWPGLTRGVPEVGYPPGKVWQGGTWGGVPSVGVPLSGYPPPPAGPGLGPPGWTWLRYPRPPPPAGPGSGTPPPGVNRLKTLPSLVRRTRSVTMLITSGFQFPCKENLTNVKTVQVKKQLSGNRKAYLNGLQASRNNG